jgi:hypothetical protein
MKEINVSIEWWDNVKAGTQDPWQRLQENDTNNQCKQFQMPINQAGGK